MNEIYRRITEIWNAPGLRDLAADQKEQLCRELEKIQKAHGVGGVSEFRAMLAEMERQ